MLAISKIPKPQIPYLVLGSNHMRKAYLQMHVAVLLYGITAILGKVITLTPIPLVWWRVLLTSVSLLFLVKAGRMFRHVSRGKMLQYLAVGCLVALHWITFFLSIKLSNASIALVALATQSLFTALIEPAVLRRPVRMYELVLGALMIPAMLLIVTEVDISMHAGIWVGLLSALLVAAFTCFNKKLVPDADPMHMSFFEMSGAWLFITLLLPIFRQPDLNGSLLPAGLDWLYLAILVLACTTLAWLLVLRALKHLSAFSSNLVANLEPVYGIVLAWLLLGEHKELTMGFYAGAALLVGIVFVNPFLARHSFRKRKPDEA